MPTLNSTMVAVQLKLAFDWAVQCHSINVLVYKNLSQKIECWSLGFANTSSSL